LDFRQLNMKMTCDDETMSGVPHPFVMGPVPSQASRAAANDFLSYSPERMEAISVLVRLPPDVMASILLADIPVDASADRGESNKIFEALDYVKAGIQHRAKHRGVYFCDGNVKLPDETFIHVLGFLDKRDLIDNVSQVSYAWTKASLSPTVRRWQTIDFYKFGEDTKIDTGDLLLQMLQRPQFALLKKLVMRCELTNILIEEIAQACPRLEELRESWINTVAFSSETLHKLPTLFPELNRIGVVMKTPSSTQDVIHLVEAIGVRLVGLEVEVHHSLESGFTEDEIVIISRHCPNLRSFGYRSIKIDPHAKNMTEGGLAALVEGCPKLEELRLIGTCRISDLEACFGYIAMNAKNLRLLDVSGNWGPTVRNDHETIRKLFAKRLESCGFFRFNLLPLP
jgi:hypothetical protein